MPLTSGVAEMLTSLKNIGSVFVIVSDANAVFIQEPLNNANLLNLFDKIFTNPADFDENGRLNMRPFTEQVVLHLHWIFCKNQNQWEDFSPKFQSAAIYIWTKIAFRAAKTHIH